MEYKDYYKILGLSRHATPDEIKRAYRKLAHKYHPDISKEKNAEQHFKEVGEAYEVLKDTEKRAAYNQLGTRWQAGENFRPPPGWNNAGCRGSGFRNTHVNHSDFFENLFGGGGQHNTRHNAFQTKGEDQQKKIAISFEEAYQGTTRTLQLTMPEMGKNRQIHSKKRTLKVKIPRGVIAGKKIRLNGQGAGGIGGGARGDLYFEIELQPHHLYRAEGKDVYMTLPITPWEAALGCTVVVPTLDGKVEIKIPANSKSGQKLRLKGRGFSTHPPGDYYIVLEMVTAKADSEVVQEFYRKMAKDFSFFNPRATKDFEQD
ncbi:MAG: DnaJ domain-containing protein [Thiomargarita sp.]|nr:DnaJ domain-containing protein [Thiomargarita sp.]